MSMRYWTWWTIVNVMLIGLGLGWYIYDLPSLVLALDGTYLTFLITAASLITTVSLGFQDKPKDWHWFMSDAVLSLGMIGTIIGFLMVLGEAFTNLDPSSIESMTAALQDMAKGASTALVTTLSGLIASIWLKFQLVVLEG